MADVTGPISSLPGRLHTVPPGMTCDSHPDRPAMYRVQGETDSFGSEMIDMCDECYQAYQQGIEASKDDTSYCDWCKTEQKGCGPTRDHDEGMSGPVYNVCPTCRSRAYDRALEELHTDFEDFDPIETCLGDDDDDDHFPIDD